MKKFLLFLVLTIMAFSQIANAQYMITTTSKNARKKEITATSFPDYPPFSDITGLQNSEQLKTVFAPALEKFAEEQNFEFNYIPFKNYQTAVHNVRQGEVDLLLGIYYATKLYSGLEYIFPAVMHNPVHVIMLPSNISKVSKVEDLKNLKGVYIKSEHFSDYMIKNFQNFNITPVETPYDAYEQLFVSDIDFIIGSYYFNYAYVLTTGLKNYVSFSKDSLWNMPLFIGVSKASKKSKALAPLLTKAINSEYFKKDITEAMQNTVHELEKKSQGIVPPKFVRVQSQDEVTPADEIKPVETATTNEQNQE